MSGGDASAGAVGPPVVVVGGTHNALSVVRCLGRRGVTVHVLNKADSEVTVSRFARWIRLPGARPLADEAATFLLGRESDWLRGAVVLASSDSALELLIAHRAALAERFRLDLSNPEAQWRMLDKQETYRAAREAGVDVPRTWEIESGDIERHRHELVFPLIVKPSLSHVHEQHFQGRKFLAVDGFEALADALRRVEAAGVRAVLMEKVPGPDNLLCSYYTYLDERSEPQLDFTKRVIRRHPKNMGLATYHVTDVVPELREPALRLFRHVGLQGLANVEFKRDPRDGRLKLIECNARFTAANGQVAASGVDLAWYVYCRIVGLPLPDVSHYRSGVRLWDPARDLRAFLELRRLGELSLAGWLRSIAHRQQFPVFSWSDPRPAVHRLLRMLRDELGGRRRR